MPPRDNDLSRFVQQATEHGSDTSHGVAQDSYFRFMDDVQSARYAYGPSSRQFTQFTNQVANNLYDNQSLRDVNMNWLKYNIDRFDIQGKHHLNLGEINLAIRTDNDAFDKEMLREAGVELQNSGKSSISIKDSDKILKSWGQQKDDATQAAYAQQRMQDSTDRSNSMLGRLTYTPDGNASNSLFAVLDDVKGGHPDGKISKGDLKAYLKQFDKRSSHGEPEVANFTSDDRNFVQNLLSQWDSPEVVRLRGTHKEQGSDGYYDRDAGNSYITVDSLKRAAGIPPYGDLFASQSCSY